ncbi:hypothetical protein BLJ79_21635 [Arthrobacter sp. UCD-GKA]|uniref:hypothetical protein n=1 Tax=Arthrobacter sp. UCD-GKA TaxID=1913576 RepID=UPI0008DD59D5|nr:hypothetical protein [Arthrobacter sp. UCD-GKA]OIH81963.1 hypothetical protein BLJ79_21635 [Arthrobacter sp. UCD-GKA]
MAEKINLRSSKVKEQKRRVADYGTETPLSSTAVERGSTRWLSGSTVVIEGLLDVTGTTTISGALNVSGTTTLSGATTIAGPTGITGALTIAGSMDVTGPTTLAGTLDITGDTSITGLLDITGRTTISNDLELLAGGLFKAGETSIEPTGKATFGTFIIDPASNKLIQAPGGWLFSDGIDQMGLSSSSTSSVNLNSSYAELNYLGSSTIRAEAGLINLNAPQISVNGKMVVTGEVTLQSATLRFTGLLPETANRPNLHIASNGRIYKSTWVP